MMGEATVGVRVGMGRDRHAPGWQQREADGGMDGCRTRAFYPSLSLSPYLCVSVSVFLCVSRASFVPSGYREGVACCIKAMEIQCEKKNI